MKLHFLQIIRIDLRLWKHRHNHSLIYAWLKCKMIKVVRILLMKWLIMI